MPTACPACGCPTCGSLACVVVGITNSPGRGHPGQHSCRPHCKQRQEQTRMPCASTPIRANPRWSESSLSSGPESLVGALPLLSSKAPKMMSMFMLSCPRLSQANEDRKTCLCFRPMGPPTAAVFLCSCKGWAHPRGLSPRS